MDMGMGMHGDDGYHGDMEQDRTEGAPRVGHTLVDRAERNRRTHAAWKARRPSDRLHAVSYFASVSHARQSQQQQQVAAMQTEIDEFFVKQQSDACGETLGRFQNHTVLYCSLEFTGGLSIPSCLCTTRGVISPPALAFGCFPNSPVEPSIWYDTSVLEFYKHLGTEEGVSATGGCCVFAGVCVCMCASMRACMRACVCVSVC
jgi:hypothetical protein